LAAEEQPPRLTHLPIHSSHEIFKNSIIQDNLTEASHFHKKSSQMAELELSDARSKKNCD
jgi:hypothetical protein